MWENKEIQMCKYYSTVYTFQIINQCYLHQFEYIKYIYLMKSSTNVFIHLMLSCFVLKAAQVDGLSGESEQNLKSSSMQELPNGPSLQTSAEQKFGANLVSNAVGAVIPPTDLAIILKNIEAINFKNPTTPQCCGILNLTNSTSASEAIRANGTSVLAVSNYGAGRAVVLASQLLFTESILLNDKNWVFLLRNLIKYAAKTAYTKYEILAVGITPTRSFKQLLGRSGIVTNITFVWDLSDFTALRKTQFQVILIGQFSLEYLKNTDFQKIVQYVYSAGGGIITTFKPQCRGCYNSPTGCTDLKRQCLHNSFLSVMGIKLQDSSIIQVPLIQYNITDKSNLTNIVLRSYSKKNATNNSTSPKGTFVDDYNAIVKDVNNITYGGAAFGSFRFSQQSFFPVIDQNKQSVMIGGRLGSGKLFLAGHPAIFTKTDSQNLKLFSNVLNWLTGNKTTIKVGFLFDNNTNWYQSFQNITGNITKSGVFNPTDLQGKDILCVNYYGNWPVNLTTTMLAAIKTYVQNGGNILFGSHGWVWGSYGQGSKNASLIYELNFASFVIANQFNVYLRENAMSISDPYFIYQPVRIVQVQNFLKNDLLAVLKGQASFTTNDTKINEYISKIQSARNFSTICDISIYHSIVDALVSSRFNIETNYNKIAPNNPLYNNVYKTMNALSYAVPASQCRALPPSLNKYPGCASKIIVNKTINVYKNRNERVYTGLYINPGEAVRITHNNIVNNVFDLTIVINHGDSLYNSNNGNLRRFPYIVKEYNIRSKDFFIASPHGGIIYFRVSKLSNLTTPLVFQILGAYQAPYFNQNQHTASQFSIIRKIDAPLFVFQTKKFVHIGPTMGLFGSVIVNIVKLCGFWNKVIQTYKIYRGISLTPFRKDSVYNDINIAAGYMHSGNPVMTFDDVVLHMLGWQNVLFLKGSWGIYHQLGHNHQDGKWTASGTVEVTCNIYSLYLTYVMQGIPAFQNPWLVGSYSSLLTKFQNYVLLPYSEKIAAYNSDARLGLYFYAILIDELGFDIFSTLHKKYDTLTNLTLPNDAAKYEMLVQQLSLVVGKNLWDYFYNWGMLVTDASKNKISSLPKYRCTRHPNLTP